MNPYFERDNRYPWGIVGVGDRWRAEQHIDGLTLQRCFDTPSAAGAHLDKFLAGVKAGLGERDALHAANSAKLATA